MSDAVDTEGRARELYEAEIRDIGNVAAPYWPTIPESEKDKYRALVNSTNATLPDIVERLRGLVARWAPDDNASRIASAAVEAIEELRWQRDHALQCGECAEWGDGCSTVRARMIQWGERDTE